MAACARILSGVVSLAMAGTAAAFATNILQGVRVWINGTKTTVFIQSFAMIRAPREADLKKIASSAAFPVIMPVGLPSGERIWALQYSPADHPTMISILYTGATAQSDFGITLFDPSSLENGKPANMPPGMSHLTFNNTGVYQWRVGGEMVGIAKRVMPPAQAERIRAATSAGSTSDSLNESRAMLSQALILGTSPSLLNVAPRYAPDSVSAIVIGPQFVDGIRDLAKRGRPMLDTRTFYVTKVPNIGGAPDYRHASFRWGHDVAIAPAGVRAIAAALQFADGSRSCKCEVVFDRSAGNTYSVWTVPIATNGAAQRYAVDSRTFAVRRVRRQGR